MGGRPPDRIFFAASGAALTGAAQQARLCRRRPRPLVTATASKRTMIESPQHARYDTGNVTGTNDKELFSLQWSLSIGATLASISILTNSFFTLFIMSGIFIVETLSVIIQVTYFKITKRIFNKGRRIFLMTPLHHHFELKGIEEKKLVENFWKINIMLVIFGIVLKINL